MVTQTCKLVFKDGKIVTAKIVADSPISSVDVEWSGETNRVPSENLIRKIHVSTLRALFKNLAKDLDAKFEESVEGTYERWER